jgi:hypothetical protein
MTTEIPLVFSQAINDAIIVLTELSFFGEETTNLYNRMIPEMEAQKAAMTGWDRVAAGRLILYVKDKYNQLKYAAEHGVVKPKEKKVCRHTGCTTYYREFSEMGDGLHDVKKCDLCGEKI